MAADILALLTDDVSQLESCLLGLSWAHVFYTPGASGTTARRPSGAVLNCVQCYALRGLKLQTGSTGFVKILVKPNILQGQISVLMGPVTGSSLCVQTENHILQ